MTIGEKIRKRRLELGWTLREFSDRMGYANHSTVSKIENGEVDISQSKLKEFSKILGVSIQYLLGLDENSNETDLIKEISKDQQFLDLYPKYKVLNNFKREMVANLVHSLSEMDSKKNKN